MSIPFTTTRSSSPAGMGAFTRNALLGAGYRMTTAYRRQPPRDDQMRYFRIEALFAGERVDQPIHVVLGVVQMETHAHRPGPCRGANTREPQLVGGFGDRYRHDGRILLRQAEFSAHPVGQPDGMRLDRGGIE